MIYTVEARMTNGYWRVVHTTYYESNAKSYAHQYERTVGLKTRVMQRAWADL